ncbi:uncharacterized protein MYCFIDRAFT_179699 [Pseudocercospora fijiensis CIRAD86]|uniref:Uncharacterized protein n=1 Tax=Pseudocercospora fijiensis (strain CIRAD86) TaxID=383855 RepID=M2YI87_PSEFD|nr:uncharacterized protein MYCFIDRAFT_179699 [Pseudocercospora fijiensis CIRAD86]EME77485.1 hypothetical protein MYCFIDRAFT_179699 [Pseudocercospora fijiensis CIRAD86]
MQKTIDFRPIFDCWDDYDKWFPCFVNVKRGSRRNANLRSYVPPGTTCRRDDKRRPHTFRQREASNARVSDAYFQVLRMRNNGGFSAFDLEQGKIRLSEAIMDLMKLTACGTHLAELAKPDNNFGERWVADLTKMVLARDPADKVPTFDPKAFGAGRIESQPGIKRKRDTVPEHSNCFGIYRLNRFRTEPEPAGKARRLRSGNVFGVDMAEQSPFPLDRDWSPSVSGSNDQGGFSSNSMQGLSQRPLDDQAWDTSISFPQAGSTKEDSGLHSGLSSFSSSASTPGNGSGGFFSSSMQQQSFGNTSIPFPQDSSAPSTSSPASGSHNSTAQPSSSYPSATSTDPQPVNAIEEYDNLLVCNFCGRDLSQAHKPVCTQVQRHSCNENHDHAINLCTGPSPKLIPVKEFCAGGTCMILGCDEDECWDLPCERKGHRRWESWRHASGCPESWNLDSGMGEVLGGGFDGGVEMGMIMGQDSGTLGWSADDLNALFPFGQDSRDDTAEGNTTHGLTTNNADPPVPVIASSSVQNNTELTADELGIGEDWDKAVQEFIELAGNLESNNGGTAVLGQDKDTTTLVENNVGDAGGFFDLTADWSDLNFELVAAEDWEKAIQEVTGIARNVERNTAVENNAGNIGNAGTFDPRAEWPGFNYEVGGMGGEDWQKVVAEFEAIAAKDRGAAVAEGASQGPMNKFGGDTGIFDREFSDLTAEWPDFNFDPGTAEDWEKAMQEVEEPGANVESKEGGTAVLDHDQGAAQAFNADDAGIFGPDDSVNAQDSSDLTIDWSQFNLDLAREWPDFDFEGVVGPRTEHGMTADLMDFKL